MFKPTKKSRKIIQSAVKKLQDYVATYDKQFDYTSYSEETFIKDIIYGIGIALDHEKYRYANGFEKFLTDRISKLIPKPESK